MLINPRQVLLMVPKILSKTASAYCVRTNKQRIHNHAVQNLDPCTLTLCPALVNKLAAVRPEIPAPTTTISKHFLHLGNPFWNI